MTKGASLEGAVCRKSGTQQFGAEVDRAICPSTVTIGSARRESRGGPHPALSTSDNAVGLTAYGCGLTRSAPTLWTDFSVS